MPADLKPCPFCGGFGFTSTPVSTDYEITVCRAKTCELCHGAGVIEAPMTNADRIRAMSDEELADMLWKTGGNYRAVCAEPVVDYNEHYEHLIEWLQQPCGGGE